MPVVEITSNEIYFNVPTNTFGGCIGIGTTIPQAQLHVSGNFAMQGHILPVTCNVYDLGSSNYRFRDLYLSGSTIDLEGVQITKDPSANGGISIKDVNENYLSARVGNLVAAGNVGIGTTNPISTLHILAPKGFNVNTTPTALFDAGSYDIRMLSTSADGNTVIVSKANYTYNNSLEVFTKNAYADWIKTTITIQNLPDGVYSGSIVRNYPGSRGYVSNDGTRIVASSGRTSGPNANVVEIFHLENNVWTSKAFLHNVGFFGWNTTISGDGNTVAITSPESSSGTRTGTIYVYKYNAGTDTWDQSLSRVYTNWPDQITLNNDGTLLAFSRTSLPPSHLGDNGNASQSLIHILKYTNGAWNNEVDDIIISPPNGILNWHYYGKSMRFSSDGLTLVVGAPGFGPNYGGSYNVLNAVFVYRTTSVAWTSYSTSTLQPASYSDYPSYDDRFNLFGNVVSVSSDGNIVVVGASFANTYTGGTDAGRAWAFQYHNNTWNIMGTVDGTIEYGYFASAVAITGDGNYLYVASRGYWNTQSISWGVVQYNFLVKGSAMNITGNVYLSDLNVDGKTTLTGQLTMNVQGDSMIGGNVGIGTTSSTFPLRIESPYTYSTGSYQSITYDNYMTWDAYTNRTNIVMVSQWGDTGGGSYKVPDFGFDFLINGNNIRNATYVTADGVVSFGGFKSYVGYNGFYIEDWDIPALVIGVSDHVVNSVSYYIGTYNQEQAIYIFYDARYYDIPSYLYKWCVIFQPNGKILLFINTIRTEYDTQLGIAVGDKKNWMVQLPNNNKTFNPALTNTAYQINIYDNLDVGVYVGGNMQVTNTLHVSTIGAGTILMYPPSALTANITNITSDLYANGQYVVTTTSTDLSAGYQLFDYDDTTYFQFPFYKYFNGTYVVNDSSTTFYDTNNNSDTIFGDWVQIQLPKAICLYSYVIIPTDISLTGAPRTYVLLGSSDGNTWYLIDDHRNNPTFYPDSREIINNVSVTTSYMYYRFVVRSVSPPNGNYPFWSGLRFYAYNDPLEINNHMTVVGSVGIGTTTPTTPLHVVGDMSIQGHILPTACNVYDLGSANFRFRDLYLSGTTIDLEGTQIAKDSTTGGISVTDSINGGLVDTSTRNLIAEGNVGIGTSNPSARIHIYHTAATDILRVDDEHVDTTPFIINQYGNLGIGMANPTQKLHVSGNSQLEGDLVVTNNITANTMISSNLYVVGDIVTMNTLSSNTEQMVITNAGTGPALKVIQTGLMSIHTIAEFVDAEDGTAMIITNGGNIGIGTTNALAKTHIYHTGTGDILRVDDSTATDTTPFIINQDGSVGIGTNNPLQKLQVNGNINVASSGNILMNTTAWDNGKVQFNSTFAGASSTTAFYLQRGGSDATKNHLVIHGDSALADGGIHFMTNGAVSRMFINASTGNVGIGTATALAKTHIYHAGTGDILRVDDQTAPDTTPFLINQDGNVGIGTNNPLQKLQVSGTVSASLFSGDGGSLTNIKRTLTTYSYEQSVPYGNFTTNRRYALVATVGAGNGLARIVGWNGGHENSFANQAKLQYDITVDTRNVYVKGIASTQGSPNNAGVAIYRDTTTSVMLIYITGGNYYRHYTEVYDLEVTTVEANLTWSVDDVFTPPTGYTLFWDSITHVPANCVLHNVYCATAVTPTYSFSALNNGSVGIGTNNPTVPLQISGNVTLDSPYTMSFGSSTRQMLNLWGSSFAIGIQDNTLYSRTGTNFAWFKGGTHSNLEFQPGAGGTVMMTLTTDANLNVAGDITVFASLSDERLKKNIYTLPSGTLDKICALRPVDFHWKDDIYHEPRRGTEDVGFIAQEVETLFPKIIKTITPPGQSDTFKGISYEKLTPYIVHALQELRDQNELLRLKVAALEQKIQ